MVASRSVSRRSARNHAVAAPDHRLVVASGLLALCVLLLMLCAGSAKASVIDGPCCVAADRPALTD